METKDLKKTKGITLISLVVSIVVLLILAGIAIVTLTGENSIINQATKAKETTAKSEFLERAKLAYADIFIEETADLKTPAITLAKIKKKLNEEQPGSVKGTGTYEITGVKYNGQEVTETLKVPDDGEITLQVETDTVSEDSKFYGFIQEKYYEILLENSEITLGEEKTLAEIEAGTSVSELTAVLEKESGATTNVDFIIDQNQKEVTIKGKGVNTGRGAGTVKISYGNTKNIGIDVVETFTVTIQAEQENNVAKGTITSPSVATQKYASGSKIILQATANEGLKLKDWYDGTSAIGTTNQFEYTVNGNKTITARFDVKLKYGDIADLGIVTVTNTTVSPNYTANLLQDWMYFYEDDDTVSNPQIYLIYANYLENAQIPTASNITKDGYNVYAKSGTSRDNLINYLKGEGTYSTVWEGFATGVETALNAKLTETQKLSGGTVKAFGAPTVEQFQGSYNENHPGDGFRAKYVTDLEHTYKDDINSTTKAIAEGYAFKNKNVDWDRAVILGNTNKELYFPVTRQTKETDSQTKNTWGFWLARFCYWRK